MAKPSTQPTTAQSLGALLKSARDIMRKDKGLNGDLGCGLRQDEQDLQDSKHWQHRDGEACASASCPSC
jgi:hypothetical protein